MNLAGVPVVSAHHAHSAWTYGTMLLFVIVVATVLIGTDLLVNTTQKVGFFQIAFNFWSKSCPTLVR